MYLFLVFAFVFVFAFIFVFVFVFVFIFVFLFDKAFHKTLCTAVQEIVTNGEGKGKGAAPTL